MTSPLLSLHCTLLCYNYGNAVLTIPTVHSVMMTLHTILMTISIVMITVPTDVIMIP